MSCGPARDVLTCLPRSRARGGAFVVNAEADRAGRARLVASETTKQRSKPIVKQSAREKRDRFDAAVATANQYLEALDFHGIFGRDTIRRSGYRECPK
jgi:hypothetical protein